MSARSRVAVVTGASSGIGAALVRRLARDGWLPVLVARRRERLEALARETGGEFEVCDVGDREAVERVAETVLARHPEISLLVNNAGIPGRIDFLTGEPERIETVMRVNYLGSVWCLRAFLRGLEAAQPADVVNVVSVAGAIAVPRSGPYAASKHAQLAFSRATAVSLRRRGIRVHAVNPGLVETDGFPQRAVLGNPLARRVVIQPDDVAETIVELVGTNDVERFVPAWYRAFALAQTLAPGATARLAARFADRPRRVGGR